MGLHQSASPLTVRKDERTAGERLENSKLSGFVAFFNVKLIFLCWHTSEYFFRVDIPTRNLDVALVQPAAKLFRGIGMPTLSRLCVLSFDIISVLSKGCQYKKLRRNMHVGR